MLKPNRIYRDGDGRKVILGCSVHINSSGYTYDSIQGHVDYTTVTEVISRTYQISTGVAIGWYSNRNIQGKFYAIKT
jgi:hypothetical protein